MSTFLRATCVWLAIYLTCGSARAEPSTELSPPVAQSSTDVPYPAGAEGDATVVLEMVIEKDGSVSAVKIVDGAEPFAAQASAVALTWRFEPARRDQQPVAARIRARVAFHREEEPIAPTATPAPSTPVAVAAAPVEPAVEITVQGERR
ncbi:MAG TPA: TonB family protein, partial [Polyangiaceae bacterium]|nr:TonB family protein [Polyangiaceae bacterium]